MIREIKEDERNKDSLKMHNFKGLFMILVVVVFLSCVFIIEKFIIDKRYFETMMYTPAYNYKCTARVSRGGFESAQCPITTLATMSDDPSIQEHGVHKNFKLKFQDISGKPQRKSGSDTHLSTSTKGIYMVAPCSI